MARDTTPTNRRAYERPEIGDDWAQAWDDLVEDLDSASLYVDSTDNTSASDPIPGTTHFENSEHESLSTGQESLTDRAMVYAYGSERNGEYLNAYPIADYGDLGAAVNAAFDANEANVMLLPPGDTNYSTTIEPTTNATIVGYGRQYNRGTRLEFNGSGAAIDQSVNDVFLEMRDFELYGPGTGSGVSAVLQSKAIRATRFQARNFQTGFSLASGGVATESSFIDCEVRIMGDRCFHYGGASANAVTWFRCTLGSCDRAAIRVSDGVGIWIDKCDIENTGRHLLVDNNGSPGQVLGLVMRDNYMETADNTQSILIDGADGARIYNNYCNLNSTEPTDKDFLNIQSGVSIQAGYNRIVGNASSRSGTTRGYFISTGAEETHIEPGSGLITSVDNSLGDSGTRTFVYGIGENAGDPNNTGQWNGNGHEGAEVVDTTNNATYHYRGGAWV